MLKTAKWPLVGVLVAMALALFAVAGCSGEANTDNSENNGDASSPTAENDNSDSGTGDGTVLKVSNGWVAYSQSDMLVLLDSDADTEYQWTAEVQGDTVLKDTDADLPSSVTNDQNADDVVGSAGMHTFGFLADAQNNGESTITMKLANTANQDDVKTTIVVKATVENGSFTDVSVQE